MVSKVKRLLTKYPVIIGYFSILVLMGMIVCHWYYSRNSEILPTVVPKELERESNLEMPNTPKEAAEYFAYALRNQDIDQFMRAFPVDELCLKESFSSIVEEEKSVSINTLAPSMEHRDYFPITSVEIVGNYADTYLEIVNRIENVNDTKVERVCYLKPKEQLKESFQQKMLKQCRVYGASAFCDMEVILKADKEFWSIPLTLVHYDGYWKVFRVGSVLQKEIEKRAELKKEDLRAADELTEKLGEVVWGEKTAFKKNKENDKSNQRLIEKGEAFLPPNYVVTNAVYRESPEKLVKTFLRYIQKKDLTSVLALGNTGSQERDLEKVTVEGLREQRDFAQKIKYFYYFILLNEDVTEEISLDKLEMASWEVLDKLNPGLFFYLEASKIVQITENEYDVYFKYEGDYYKFEFEFSKFEQGWQIKDIRNGKKMSQKGYETKLQELEKNG